MKALIVKETGKVIQIEAAEFEVHEDCMWVDCTEEVEPRWIYSDGEFSAPVVEPLTYEMAREMAYPSIQEQLDMQYWDSVNGTTTWADAIAEVKADNPKPE